MAIDAADQCDSLSSRCNSIAEPISDITNIQLPPGLQTNNNLSVLGVFHLRIKLGEILQAQLGALRRQQMIECRTQESLKDESSLIKVLLDKTKNDLNRLILETEAMQRDILETEEVISLTQRPCFKSFQSFTNIAMNCQTEQKGKMQVLQYISQAKERNIQVIRLVLEYNQREIHELVEQSERLDTRINSIMGLSEEEVRVNRDIKMLVEQIASADS